MDAHYSVRGLGLRAGELTSCLLDAAADLLREVCDERSGSVELPRVELEGTL